MQTLQVSIQFYEVWCPTRVYVPISLSAFRLRHSSEPQGRLGETMAWGPWQKVDIWSEFTLVMKGDVTPPKKKYKNWRNLCRFSLFSRVFYWWMMITTFCTAQIFFSQCQMHFELQADVTTTTRSEVLGLLWLLDFHILCQGSPSHPMVPWSPSRFVNICDMCDGPPAVFFMVGCDQGCGIAASCQAWWDDPTRTIDVSWQMNTNGIQWNNWGWVRVSKLRRCWT